MRSRHLLSFLLLALVAVLHRESIHAEATTLLEDTCKSVAHDRHRIDYDFCVSSLQTDARSRTAADASVLGVVALELTLSNVNFTQELIKQFAESDYTVPPTKQKLRKCAGLYSETVSLFDGAAEDMTAKAYKDASSKLKKGANKTIQCDKLYLETFDGGEILVRQTGDCMKLAIISSVIVSSLS